MAWLSLLSSMYQSFTKTPFLDIFENTYENCPNHNIEYTKELYKNDFYNDIDDEYKLLGKYI